MDRTTKQQKAVVTGEEAEPELIRETEETSAKIPNNSTDDSGDTVLVDLEEVEDHPQALQIVSIGTKEDAYAFTFHKERLEAIIKRIPEGTKVAVVSVVGAFRTGKSFLLCWFLRYLHYLQEKEEKGDDSPTDFNWYEGVESLNHNGFHWRAGSERNTTGIWMWSHPHILQKQKLAVLLVDTQGMFDNETTMSLTASIFGLSTLLSSFQIYNVDKMIQEDNLQHLALFSEYARAAMANKQENEGGKPFQHVEFLVRDWQHFEEEEDFDEMVKEMEGVLEKVMQNRDAKDLQETRDQINLCFEDISCYGLPHPGFAVTKRSYNGEVDKIENHFLELLGRYCPRVFDNLSPKIIHGRELTGEELTTYIESYAKLFASGASFPEASTMLEATAAANNTNATNLAIKSYEQHMDRIAGPQCSNYMKSEELKEDHRRYFHEAMEVFESVANFGSKKTIEKSKRDLMDRIDREYETYQKLNESRNPLLGLELYLLPLGVGLVSYIIRSLMEWTCSPWSQVCRSSSDLLSHVYAVVGCFLIIVASTKAKQVGDFAERLKVVFQAVNNSGNTAPANSGLRGSKKAKPE